MKSQIHKKLLYVGSVGSYGGHNTTLHRFRGFQQIFTEAVVLDTAPKKWSKAESLVYRAAYMLYRKGIDVPLPDFSRVNQQLVDRAQALKPDMIWLDKPLLVSPKTIRTIKSKLPATKVFYFSPDDNGNRGNVSAQIVRSLPLIDGFVTNKSYNVGELKKRGCKKVYFVNNSYDPEAFRPIDPRPSELKEYQTDIGFIGTYEHDRATRIKSLAEAGFKVRIWGNGWDSICQTTKNLKIENRPLYGDEFCKACGVIKINLNFLRKANRDLQTTRSIEIPACRGMMLAERTPEHHQLFTEGEEAEYFGSPQELIEKCSFYLENPEKRSSIAASGYNRCHKEGYSHESTFRRLLSEEIFPVHSEK